MIFVEDQHAAQENRDLFVQRAGWLTALEEPSPRTNEERNQLCGSATKKFFNCGFEELNTRFCFLLF